ncbi:MAG: HD family phosphohydrolase [Cellulosilyticaceae bacterium]
MKREKYLENVLLMFSILITFFAVISGNFFGEKLTLEIGQISSETIYAPFQVENELATGRKKALAAQTVSPVYTIDHSVQEQALETIDLLFKYIEVIKTSGIAESYNISQVEQLQIKSPISLYADEYDFLLKQDLAMLQTMHDTAINITKLMFEEGVDETENTSTIIRGLLEETSLTGLYQKVTYEIVSSQMRVNHIIDIEATEKARIQAMETVEPIYILQGEKIIGQGSRLTEESYLILQKVGYLDTDTSDKYTQYIGIMILLILTIVFFAKYIRTTTFIKDFEFKQNSLLFILYIISVGMITVMTSTKFFYLPLAIGPMLIAILMRKDIAFVFQVVLLVLAALIHKGDILFILYLLISGILSIVIISNMQERKQTVKSALIVGLTYGSVYLGLKLVVGVSLNAVLLAESLQAGLVGLLCVVVVVGSLPLWEAAFGFITPIQLLELTNPNQPILKRLLIEATGTYYHSLLVANLAESAADSIGANPLMARVGGYYHDIGKLECVNYFKENQVRENPHDYMQPLQSAHIIKSHVTSGIVLAQTYKLPLCIKDIIMQHHGKSTMQYFYIKAREMDDTVAEHHFSYPGPKPQTKEAALVMLADVVEATVRSMQHKIGVELSVEDIVRKMVKQKLEEGELDECPLYISDIEKIILSFTRMLKGMYHERIEYPERKGQ